MLRKNVTALTQHDMNGEKALYKGKHGNDNNTNNNEDDHANNIDSKDDYSYKYYY